MEAAGEKSEELETCNETLQTENEQLKAQAEADRMNFALALAGCRNVKAAHAVLDDYNGDIEALEAAEPWLFAAHAEATGATSLPNAGAAKDDGKDERRWRKCLRCQAGNEQSGTCNLSSLAPHSANLPFLCFCRLFSPPAQGIEITHKAFSRARDSCCPDNVRAEGFFGTLKEEFYNGRDWSQMGFNEFKKRLDAYIEWYVSGRLKAFDEGGRKVYDTIAGRRRRLGYTV